MPVILALPAAILISISVILLEAGIQTLIDELRSASERRNKLKQLDARIRVWTSLAAEESDPIEKGYKTARLLNLEYEKTLAEAREEKKETKNITYCHYSSKRRKSQWIRKNILMLRVSGADTSKR